MPFRKYPGYIKEGVVGQAECRPGVGYSAYGCHQTTQTAGYLHHMHNDLHTACTILDTFWMALL